MCTYNPSNIKTLTGKYMASLALLANYRQVRDPVLIFLLLLFVILLLLFVKYHFFVIFFLQDSGFLCHHDVLTLVMWMRN